MDLCHPAGQHFGSLTYGLITWLSDGNQRLAIGSTSLLFVLGLILLMPVDVERGRRAAQLPS